MTRMLDFHTHPSLKMHYLPYLRSSFHALVYSGRFWNPLSFRNRYANLNRSPVQVMLCAHYVIERGFVTQGIRWFSRAVCWAAAPWFYGPLRTADPWKTVQKMMNKLEASVDNTNRWAPRNGKRLRLARRFSDLANLKKNEIALIHAIEGAHALGYGPEQGEDLETFWKRVERRLEGLKDRGVCTITLAHFWDSPFCPQTDGTEEVPARVDGAVVGRKDDLLFRMKRASWRWDDPGHLADAITRKLLDLGILIDVSHCQEHARWAVYDMCEQVDRPVVASHVGLQHFFNHEYNLSDEEVRRIHRLGGVVGLILSRRWLVHPIDRYGSDGCGIDDLVANMRYIRELVGDVDCIGIGTDFDGLTDPLKDCETPDQLDRLAQAMPLYFSDEEIDRILFGNGMRVLEKGWV